MALKFLLSFVVLGLTACDAGEKYEQDRLVTEKDGVRVYSHEECYKYKDGKSNCYNGFYFSVPCGDINWRERVGKVTRERQVSGAGCK